MFPYRLKSCVLMASLAGAALTGSVWADIQVSNELQTTVGGLSSGTSSQALTGNLVILENRIDTLEAQLTSVQAQLYGMPSSSSSYMGLQTKASQLKATIGALQAIMAKVQAGYAITGYEIATDSSTLDNVATITFSKGGQTTTLVVEIPPVVTGGGGSGGDSGSDEEDGAAASDESFDPVDMLTQALQQIGMQMMAGGVNPLTAVQNTLNDMVGQANNPITDGKQCQGTSGQDTATPGVAVYDIAAGKVYMPDGTVLEAHSGMGAMMDNPSFVNQRMNGPTPPNVYNLSLRESRYYGVEALRMTPTDPGSMYGRNGILAHSKLVRGANNGSHGCVAFADYGKFLAAFKSGQVRQLVVVPRKAGGTGAQAQCEGVRYTEKDPHPDAK